MPSLPPHIGAGPDGRTHYLFAPFDSRVALQSLTLCGTKAAPLRDAVVDCKPCKEARD